MNSSSSGLSQPLAFYWTHHISPHKCWLVYYHQSFPVQCIEVKLLSCCTPPLCSHFLSLCPRGDPSGILHHSLSSFILNLKWFTHRAINKYFPDKHISSRQQECQAVTTHRTETGVVLYCAEICLCNRAWEENYDICASRWAPGAVMNRAACGFTALCIPRSGPFTVTTPPCAVQSVNSLESHMDLSMPKKRCSIEFLLTPFQTQFTPLLGFIAYQ